ncbi:MAG: hypothetical protein NTV57_14920 [Cyanobacteria bacterium]|nr:hypothetical protein [Cyanobacteriota bacterium]
MTQSYPGQIPAGMLRIHQGNQEHYVWPVHLPGWLLLGWRVAGSANAPAAPADVPLPQAETALAAVLEPTSQATAIETGPEPSTGRGKRGRRRKEEEPPTAVVETAPAVIGIADEEGNADSEPPAADESTDAQSSTEPAVTSAASDVATGPAAESGAVPAAAEAFTEPDVSLSALPDDLFDDPLI